MIADFAPPKTDTPIHWALAYAACRNACFPVSTDKKPLTGHGVKDATIDAFVINAWWTRWPHADPAWAVPPGVVVMDLDVDKGADGIRDFAVHEGKAARRCADASGHYAARRSTPRLSTNGATYRNAVKANGSSIDLRTLGGYVVLPAGSNGCDCGRSRSTPRSRMSRNWVSLAPKVEAPLTRRRTGHSRARQRTRARPSSARAWRSKKPRTDSRSDVKQAVLSASAASSARASSTARRPSRRCSRPPT